jgi:hypothetical protein
MGWWSEGLRKRNMKNIRRRVQWKQRLFAHNEKLANQSTLRKQLKLSSIGKVYGRGRLEPDSSPSVRTFGEGLTTRNANSR